MFLINGWEMRCWFKQKNKKHNAVSSCETERGVQLGQSNLRKESYDD